MDTVTTENSMKITKKTRPKLPYDPAVPLLGIYPEKTIIQKDTCTPMFTAVLFTTGHGSNLDVHGQKMDKEIVVQSTQWNTAQP